MLSNRVHLFFISTSRLLISKHNKKPLQRHMNGKSEITGRASTPPPLPASPLSCLFLSLSTSPCVDSCLRVHDSPQLRGSGDSLAPIGGVRDAVFLALCCFVFGERRPERSGAFLSVLSISAPQRLGEGSAAERTRGGVAGRCAFAEGEDPEEEEEEVGGGGGERGRITGLTEHRHTSLITHHRAIATACPGDG